ncbi:Heptahelical transmembrane protein 4 [Bienertia sinuspersici]
MDVKSKMGKQSVQSQRSSSSRNNKQGKGKRFWKKVKYQLVEYHSLPGYLRDNEYIKGHYRANWPLKHALYSIFSIHNETLNVWTHLIGFLFFLCLTIYTAKKVPNVVDLHSIQHLPDVFKTDLHKIHADLLTCLPSLPDIMTDELANMIAPLIRRPITRWPFFAFLGGAMFCLLASSTCHLLTCHSERLAYIMLRVDYAGIASLISTSFYPLVYYSFMCYPFFCYLYMGFITVLAVSTVLFSLLPAFQNPEFRTIRAVLFSGMALSGILPILHKNYLYWGRPAALHTTGYEVLMGLFYGSELWFMQPEFLNDGCLGNLILQDTVISSFIYWLLLVRTVIIVQGWCIFNGETWKAVD